MQTAAALLTASAAALLVVGARRSSGPIEGAGPLDGFGLDALSDRAESFFNVMTQNPVNVTPDAAAVNVGAFLATLRRAEGTEGRGDPYRVCYGYRHTIASLANHPAVTGEWRGERLPDAMCRRAGFGPGCVSSAAGAYQIVKGTWLSVSSSIGLRDFGPASQDAAAVELVRRRGALADVQAGRFADAVRKCRNEWASLPGNYAGQGQRSIDTLAAWYGDAGGSFA